MTPQDRLGAAAPQDRVHKTVTVHVIRQPGISEKVHYRTVDKAFDWIDSADRRDRLITNFYGTSTAKRHGLDSTLWVVSGWSDAIGELHAFLAEQARYHDRIVWIEGNPQVVASAGSGLDFRPVLPAT